MNNFIFIAGAPGSGKSTVAKLLQQKLDSPIFEFGWIPEFQNTGDRIMPYAEEESMAFENLTLVVKNYAKHGFKNVIITDLNNDYIEKLADIFDKYSYTLFTLRITDDETVKSRVLNETRSSGYRDWQEALDINQKLLKRSALKNEVFIDATYSSPEHIVAEMMTTLQSDKH